MHSIHGDGAKQSRETHEVDHPMTSPPPREDPAIKSGFWLRGSTLLEVAVA
jgi:hypothetical protein